MKGAEGLNKIECGMCKHCPAARTRSGQRKCSTVTYGRHTRGVSNTGLLPKSSSWLEKLRSMDASTIYMWHCWGLHPVHNLGWETAMSGMPARGICHICARMPRAYLVDWQAPCWNIDVVFVLSCSLSSDLRWLKTVSSTFEDLDFNVPLWPLFIN